MTDEEYDAKYAHEYGDEVAGDYLLPVRMYGTKKYYGEEPSIEGDVFYQLKYDGMAVLIEYKRNSPEVESRGSSLSDKLFPRYFYCLILKIKGDYAENPVKSRHKIKTFCKRAEVK
jgi:hypothetical protein